MNGRMVVSVEIDDTAVPLALRGKYLDADAVDDRAAIARAIEQLIDDYVALVAADASAHDPWSR